MISVVIPAYNEAERIAGVVKKAKAYADEVLVIDDRSSDRTSQVAKEAGATVIRNKGEKGYIGSVKTGLREAKGDIVVTLDADGEHNAEEIPLLTQPIYNGKADVVIGRREKIPRISEKLLSWLACIKTGIVDSGSGFRAIKKDFALKLKFEGSCICGLSALEMHRIGAQVLEVPITINNMDKKRNISWGHLFQFFHVLRWMLK
jgi:glycosyltransferase involved in cell wall biosynthesis